ncbi:MAG: hypothetical protein ACI4Q7_02395 [Candidatus Avelusimicrobium sp.]
MIQGNCNRQKVYVHAELVALRLLLRLGWNVPAGWADEVLAEVVSSREVCGYWYYHCWVPTPAGNKILMELAEWQLFACVEDAYYDREREAARKSLYKYAKNYRVQKPSTLKRFFNFLANKHQASALPLPARPENAPDGATLPVRPI